MHRPQRRARREDDALHRSGPRIVVARGKMLDALDHRFERFPRRAAHARSVGADRFARCSAATQHEPDTEPLCDGEDDIGPIARVGFAVKKVMIAHGRRAREHEFDDPDRGGNFERALVESMPIPKEHLAHPAFERQADAGGHAFEQRLKKMLVRADQPRIHHTVVRIDGDLAGDLGNPADLGDAAVANPDIAGRSFGRAAQAGEQTDGTAYDRIVGVDDRVLFNDGPAAFVDFWPKLRRRVQRIFSSMARETISDADAEFYRENGYVIVEDIIDQETVAAILAEGAQVCRGNRGNVDGLLPSAESDTDYEVLSKYVTCTHVHKNSDYLTGFFSHPKLVDAVGQIVGENVKGFASQFFIKHAGMPGNAWHQDENFVPTRDRSLCTAWIALDEATLENGCLWMIPGSHKPGVLYPMRPHNNPNLDRAEECYDFEGLETAVPIVLKPGSCVFFSGYILHSSTTNTLESGFRRALLFQYARAETPLAYGAKNEPVSNYHDMRDFVLVRGIDPYFWKARTDEMVAFLRSPGPMRQDLALSVMREREKTLAT